mmetsp:Transcript_30531/g.59906  ORF Transcript_30531/g.59906 Transcript_30531/m.59906 type:complete len:119 (+) Transcript_30531:1130-1486(+)
MMTAGSCCHAPMTVPLVMLNPSQYSIAIRGHPCKRRHVTGNSATCKLRALPQKRHLQLQEGDRHAELDVDSCRHEAFKLKGKCISCLSLPGRKKLFIPALQFNEIAQGSNSVADAHIN